MFSNCISITSIDLNSLNTENVKDMKEMFYNCTNLEKITFSKNLKTSKVIYSESQFTYCSSLENLDLSSFKSIEAMETEKMFYGYSKLKEINFNRKTPVKLNNFKSMFEDCTNLKSLNLSFLVYIKGLGYTSRMFKNCISLENINFQKISSFFLFNTDEKLSCKSLGRFDLGTINTLTVTNMEKMFMAALH